MRFLTPAAATLAAGAVLVFALPAPSTFARVLDGTMTYAPERQSARCVFFGTQTVSGSYSIDYGAPEWRADYDSTFDDLTLGKRLRFGKDQWTTLDASCALAFGKTDVTAGLYYCVLERSKKGDFSLVLLEADEIRKSKLDPFASAQTKGGIAIALSHEKVGESAGNLRIEVEKDAQNEKEQTLRISFGPHRLTARVKAKI
jgi:Protein of unknown function (DUF2911)